jgi:hypothetical protein
MFCNQKSSIENRKCRQRRRAGFTLIEAALTTVIIGTGVLAIVAAQQAYHIKNDWAARTGTAQLLANELRELTLSLPHHDPITGATNLGPESNESAGVTDWDDLDDFAGTVTAGFGTGTTFIPPINALRENLADLDQWSQVIRVENVLPENLDAASDETQALGTTNMMRVTVDVMYQAHPGENAEPVTSLTWVVPE